MYQNAEAHFPEKICLSKSKIRLSVACNCQHQCTFKTKKENSNGTMPRLKTCYENCNLTSHTSEALDFESMTCAHSGEMIMRSSCGAYAEADSIKGALRSDGESSSFCC